LALAALTLGDTAPDTPLTVGTLGGAAVVGLALGLSARALCLAGRAVTGLLEAGLPGRAPLGVAGELWFGLLLVLQGGHVALMEAAAMSLRWLPVDGPTPAAGLMPLLGRAVTSAWALAVGLALPLLMAAAALEVGLGVAGRVSMVRWADAQGLRDRGGVRGELVRWAAAWALVMATARAIGPWWAEALSAWGL
jgi:hypothetical protein